MHQLKNFKTILIVMGEPKSIFPEILIKYFKSSSFNRLKKKIVIIGSKNELVKYSKKLKYNIRLNEINYLKQSKYNKINIINVKYNLGKYDTKITNKSKLYIEKCFNLAIKILNENKECILFNGPISKKHFLDKKYPGITEYLANKTFSSGEVMLIYNENLAVSPISTHIPLSKISNKISKSKIINNILTINKFYKFYFKKMPNFAVLGLNPHCETSNKFSEEKKIIAPAIEFLKKKKLKIKGPFSTDTFFINKNLKMFDVVIGMYHDQVLTPLKTIYEFDAINITLGLPFLRISPDHGPNIKMLGKNKSDPSSIFCAMKFLNKIK